MSDTYESFKDLFQHEFSNRYRIEAVKRTPGYLIMAPHGGRIEQYTTEIAKTVAGDNISYYSFIGNKATDNKSLHITSTHFDEPIAEALLKQIDTVIAIHGCADDDSYAQITYLGGANIHLRDKIAKSLEDAGFDVGVHKNPALSGENPKNICNRGRLAVYGYNAGGVQLEISNSERISLGQFLERKEKFAAAIRSALLE